MCNNNKEKIKFFVADMLLKSHQKMVDNIDHLLLSGAIDIENWDENSNPMILPKSIVMVLLENEANQYSSKGTCFEKQIKKEVKNLHHFI